MGNRSNADALKNKLECLRARDVSAMGYETRSRHRRRIEELERAYRDALAEVDRLETHPSPSEPQPVPAE